MLYSNLFRLLYSAPQKYTYYRKISKNTDFMRRYTLLGILYIFNALLWGMIKKKIDKIHPLLHKEFVFETPFGKFLGATVNQWTVLAPDYEPKIQKVIREVTEKTPITERVLVNIGAHIGRYAIELVKNHNYTAYCFEPNPQTFKILQTNTLLSEIEDRCFVFPYGLWDKNTTVEFEHVEYNDGSSRVIQWDDQDLGKNTLIQIDVKVFDKLHMDLVPSLIIIDVEGFELHVLRGMEQSLTTYWQVDLIIEIFEKSPRREETIAYLTKIWFNYRKIDNDNYHFRKA